MAFPSLTIRSYFGLPQLPPQTAESALSETFKITQLGNACVGINASGRVCAIGGWDGSYVSSLSTLDWPVAPVADTLADLAL